MPKMPVKRWTGSPGHVLIRELLALIENGTPLPAASKELWTNTLIEVSLANNKKEAGANFTRSLDLNFKTGKPIGDTVHTVYRVEMAVLNGQTKEAAYVEIADDKSRSRDTIRTAYNNYRKNWPDDYASIKLFAKLNFEEGKIECTAPILDLYLALVRNHNDPAFTDLTPPHEKE